LKLQPSGERYAALDVADQGKDKNAFCGAYGFLIETTEEWSGKGGDIFESLQKSFMMCEEGKYKLLIYDEDGLGAGVKGDARIINSSRTDKIRVEPFRGSGKVIDPKKKFNNTDRTNEDYFANRKAQAWWSLRTRFRNTYRWVVEGKPCNPDDIISIEPNCKNREKLVGELSQPTYGINKVGKILVNKMPEGTESPNLADAAMMRYAKRKNIPLHISGDMLAKLRVRGRM
jgi:hypothetical protein